MQHQSEDMPSSSKRRKVDKASVYDAVAGRIGYDGFLTKKQPSRFRDTASTTATAVPADEVLFRRKNAPSRYAEDDIYFADRHLPQSKQLPDSDLLKIIHAYVAGFYAHGPGTPNSLNYRSLDETALLGLGILVEEAAREAVGQNGDLALTEFITHDGDEHSDS